MTEVAGPGVPIKPPEPPKPPEKRSETSKPPEDEKPELKENGERKELRPPPDRALESVARWAREHTEIGKGWLEESSTAELVQRLQAEGPTGDLSQEEGAELEAQVETLTDLSRALSELESGNFPREILAKYFPHDLEGAGGLRWKLSSGYRQEVTSRLTRLVSEEQARIHQGQEEHWKQEEEGILGLLSPEAAEDEKKVEMKTGGLGERVGTFNPDMSVFRYNEAFDLYLNFPQVFTQRAQRILEARSRVSRLRRYGEITGKVRTKEDRTYPLTEEEKKLEEIEGKLNSGPKGLLAWRNQQIMGYLGLSGVLVVNLASSESLLGKALEGGRDWSAYSNRATLERFRTIPAGEQIAAVEELAKTAKSILEREKEGLFAEWNSGSKERFNRLITEGLDKGVMKMRERVADYEAHNELIRRSLVSHTTTEEGVMDAILAGELHSQWEQIGRRRQPRDNSPASERGRVHAEVSFSINGAEEQYGDIALIFPYTRAVEGRVFLEHGNSQRGGGSPELHVFNENFDARRNPNVGVAIPIEEGIILIPEEKRVKFVEWLAKGAGKSEEWIERRVRFYPGGRGSLEAYVRSSFFQGRLFPQVPEGALIPTEQTGLQAGDTPLTLFRWVSA